MPERDVVSTTITNRTASIMCGGAALPMRSRNAARYLWLSLDYNPFCFMLAPERRYVSAWVLGYRSA